MLKITICSTYPMNSVSNIDKSSKVRLLRPLD